MKNKDIRKLRKSYNKYSLDDEISEYPFDLFDKWFRDAKSNKLIEEPNAMALSTNGIDDYPRSRIVLLKEYSENGFVFFTNYNSIKGKSISKSNKVCLTFFWSTLERQIIISGIAKKISSKNSDEYFNSRPIGSRIGAIVSPQSERIPSRDYLDNILKKNISKKKKIIRPSHWGGYLVEPITFEFWQGRKDRLHDRIEFVKNNNKWINYRLAP
ncbi:MAG: pyridoxamine 5'-phosphate oxidase [Flavobacteriaceae bacterium]|nr:pyridoxamine 5'-phosphate oxidase [Flavobacteriaceae bacterium]